MEKLKRKCRELLILFFLIIISIFLIIFLIKINKLSLKVPLVYNGWDAMNFYAKGKMIKETGWILNNPLLGAPFSSFSYDYIANMFSNVDNLLLKIIIFFSGDPIIGCNLYFISIFPITASISFFVMNKLKINIFISFCMSILFAFTPYILMRGVTHSVLSSAFFIPLSILLCLWLYSSDDNYLIFSKNFFSEKKNWLTVIFCVLIANNGIGYYQFFTCFFIIVTTIIKLNVNNYKYKVKQGVKILFFISLFFVLAALPSVFFFLKNGTNPEAIIRTAGEAEIHGLKITLLYLPISSTIVKLKNIISNYVTTAPLTYENRCEYLGILGSLGFTVLLLKLFKRKLFEFQNDILSFLSKLNLSAILLGTIGGFGSLFSYVISSKIRCYNRISVYIAYLSLLALAILFNEILKKYKYHFFIYISIFVISSLALFEQMHNIRSLGDVDFVYLSEHENKDVINSNFKSDKKFFEKIEKLLPKNSMVFQLPYHPFPESGLVNNMKDYHLIIGYLHSKTLRWSYGGIKGRESDLWNRNVSSLNLNNMIKILSIAGFSGIYIDERAYKETELNDLRKKIENILKESPVESENGNLLFYNMLEYNEKNSFSAEKRKNILNNIISFSKGCYGYEENKDTSEYWRWLNKEAEIIINNIIPDEQEYDFNIYLNTFTFKNNPSTVEIFLNGVKIKTYLVNNEKEEIKEKLHLRLGKNIITIKTNAEMVNVPTESRELYLQMSNYKMFDFE